MTCRPRPELAACGWVVAALALMLTLLAFTGVAHAGKVIPPGKEDTIRALLEPHALAQPVAAGFVLHDMRIDRDAIVLALRDEAGTRSATLTLSPRALLDDAASVSFSFAFAGDEGARPAADALITAIKLHDRGEVYIDVEDAPRSDALPGDPTHEPAARGPPEHEHEHDEPSWTNAARARWLGERVGWAALALVVLAGVRRRLGERLHVRDELLASAVIVAAFAAAAGYAWTCDDATISLRYAHNLAQGHGLVFNLGERVQGFTNPLWTLLLALGALRGSHLAWAITLGLACTWATLVILHACARRLELRAWQFALVVLLAFACQPVLAFSTSGLENAATHMLVSACLLALLAGRPNLVLLSAALALLGRLDSAPLLAPLVVLAWLRAGTSTRARLTACRRGLAFGLLVLGGWLVFATLYYGYPLPNTWYAKGGLRVGMGLRYLGDFASQRPSSTLVLLGAPLLAWSRLRGEPESAPLRAAALGVLAQVGYVVAVGGDYMHGRFFTAALLVASLCLVGVLARAWPQQRLAWLLVAGLALTSTLELARTHVERGMFVIERDPEYALWRRGPVEVVPPPADPALAGVAISNHLIGQVFGSDPNLAWIDGYGLIDPYVARCPMTEPDPRPGHAQRLVPSAYLRARGDVRQLADGRARLDAHDPTLAPELAAMQTAPAWPSDEHRRRYEELELLTRGPLWAPERLRLIPKYVLGRQAIPPVDAHEAFDIVGP